MNPVATHGITGPGLHQRTRAWENRRNQPHTRRSGSMDKKAKTPKKPKQSKAKDGAKTK
jgi:hypothetical protein